MTIKKEMVVDSLNLIKIKSSSSDKNLFIIDYLRSKLAFQLVAWT